MTDYNPLAGIAQDDTSKQISALLSALNNLIGLFSPDNVGRLRVIADIPNGTGLSVINTVSTLTNQAQIGGIAANQQIQSLSQMSEFNLRQKI